MGVVDSITFEYAIKDELQNCVFQTKSLTQRMDNFVIDSRGQLQWLYPDDGGDFGVTTHRIFLPFSGTIDVWTALDSIMYNFVVVMKSGKVNLIKDYREIAPVHRA